MQILGAKNFSERSKLAIGVIGLLVVIALLTLALNAGPLLRSLTSDTYTADFAEIGNLRESDAVQVGGFTVGKVTSIELEGDHVAVTLSVQRGGSLGRDTRAAIKTDNPLGTKVVALSPEGLGQMQSGDTIPLPRTTAPYDVNQILAQLTTETGQIDTRQLATALGTVADTFQNTPPELRDTLRGVSRISQTIASRDAALRTLLRNANDVTGVLADRRQQLQKIFSDGNLLLEELYARRDTIHALLVNATAALDQAQGLVRDNQAQIGPTLNQLRGVTDLLIHNEKNISASITGLNLYAGTLGEAVGGGPWFFAYIPNLVPSNLLPPLTQLLDPNVGSPLASTTSALTPALTAPAAGGGH